MLFIVISSLLKMAFAQMNEEFNLRSFTGLVSRKLYRLEINSFVMKIHD